MPEYLVIARKYRPATFEQLVGQEHIARTLQNAITQNKLAHAFLFCGPRGVGKTTTARILAKALNCRTGPTPTPCCKCSPCLEIPESNCLDVIEIDGASNNSVDDIRLLRENARYAPSRDRFKIYIIDEVHMLTASAFNALLKTLEEPPSHVKFIFATTAPERIPATILSRCQRYNFRRIGRAQMLSNLRQIAVDEGIDAEDDALGFIAEQAGGSMRDAQSVLDQARSVTTGTLTLREVSRLLSATDSAFLTEFVDALISRDPASVISNVEELFSQGVNFRTFLADLVSYFHKMLLVLSVGEQQLDHLEMTTEEAGRLTEQANRTGKDRLFLYLNKLLSVENQIIRSSIPRVSFEVAVLGLCHIEDTVSVESLLSKLSKVQKMALEGGVGLLEPTIGRADRASQASLLGQPRPTAEHKTASPPMVKPSSPAPPENTAPVEAPSAPEVPRKPAPREPRSEVVAPASPARESESASNEGAKPENEALYNASRIPIVEKTMEMFDGAIGDVKKRE